MRTIINSLKVVIACLVLFNVGTPLAETTEIEAADQLTVQQCRLEEQTPVQLVHGQHPHHHHHPYPPHPYLPPHSYPSVYPPPYPYYAPYPASGICRNKLLFCHMNAVLPVGSPCVCHTSFGAVWFSGWVAAY